MNTSPFGGGGAGPDMLREAVARGTKALQEFNAASRHNVEAMLASLNAAARGAETVRDDAMTYCKRLADEGAEAVKALTAAKSVEDAIKVQTRYAQKWAVGYTEQMGRMAETMTSSVRASMQPLEKMAEEAIKTIRDGVKKT